MPEGVLNSSDTFAPRLHLLCAVESQAYPILLRLGKLGKVDVRMCLMCLGRFCMLLSGGVQAIDSVHRFALGWLSTSVVIELHVTYIQIVCPTWCQLGGALFSPWPR